MENDILTQPMKELILLVSKKNQLNSKRKNAQWRVRYYKRIHFLKKMRDHKLPKKWNNISLSDIHHTILKNEADLLNSRIHILNFNKKFLKKMHALKSSLADISNDISLLVAFNYDGGNFISLSVSSPRWDTLQAHLYPQDIRKIAEEYEATLALEKMLTKE